MQSFRIILGENLRRTKLTFTCIFSKINSSLKMSPRFPNIRMLENGLCYKEANSTVLSLVNVLTVNARLFAKIVVAVKFATMVNEKYIAKSVEEVVSVVTVNKKDDAKNVKEVVSATMAK